MTAGESANVDDAPLMIGEWRVDPRADEIESGGRVIKLEPLRMRLLMALARRPGQVVLSNELLDTVWKGVIVTPGSLYQSVAQLRQLLGDSVTEPRYIATVPRKGYRLVAPVTPLPLLQRVPPAPPVDPSPPAAVTPEVLPAPVPVASNTPDVTLGRQRIDRRQLIAAGAAAAAAFAAGGVWWWNHRPAPRTLRIAVLPFSDRSSTRLDQPLANGLTEDVIRALGRHPGLEVLAFDAVARLPQTADMLAQAFKRLDVSFALTGVLTRASAERVRVSTQLVALPDEQVRQSSAFEESIARVSTLPQAIALRAIEALDLAPALPASKALASSAYEMYVLGIDAMRAKTPESVERARRYFVQGIDVDALYARNYSGLASSWIVQSEVGGGQLEWREAFARAEPIYAKALQLDPDLVEAKLGLANVALHYRRFDEARRTLQAVIQAHPNNVQAYFSLGLTEEQDGWPSRAAPHYERAAALDPTHFLIPLRTGLSLMYLGRLGEAEARFKRSIELDSARPNGFYSLGILNWVRGALDESVAAYRQAVQRGDQASYIWNDYAFVCLDLGLYEEARRSFERAATLLRAPSAALVQAGYIWLAEGARAPLPKELGNTVSSPAPWERLMILAMAGERPSVPAVSAVATEQAAYTALPSPLYQILGGRFQALDIASLFAFAGARDRSTQLVDEAERTLNEYEQRGLTVPSFSFHRARVQALRGDAARALALLQAAVEKGWRRTWWMRRDPALESLRADVTFNAMLQKVDAQLAAQRKNVAQ